MSEPRIVGDYQLLNKSGNLFSIIENPHFKPGEVR